MSSRPATPARLRAISLVAIAAALPLIAAACSDDETASTTTAAATTEVPATTGAATTTAASGTTVDSGLSAKLLTAADLGSAWELGEPVNEMDLTMNAEVCKGVVLDAELAARLNGQTGVQFQPTDRSSKHLMVQIITGEAGQLASDLDAYAAALKTCPVDPVGAEDTFLSVEDITLPAWGEQAHGIAVRAQESGNGAVWFVRFIQVRVGGEAVGLGLTEILGSATAAPAFTDADLIGWAEKAVAKLST